MWKLSTRIVSDRVAIVSASAGVNFLRSKRVTPGRLFKSKIISIENKTSAYTVLRVGVYNRGLFYNYFEEMAPSAGQIYWSVDEMIVAEGQQVQAELQGCSTGDSLEMFLHGSWVFEGI